MYAATRVHLKYCTRRNFEFYRFSKYLGSQPLQKDRITLELLEVIHETVTVTKVLRKNVIIVIFKKIYFAQFYISLLLESWFLVFRRGLRNFKST